MPTAIAPFSFLKPTDASTAMDQYSLGQKQALINALKSQVMSPQQPTNYGQMASPMSPVSTFAQALGGYLAGKQQKQLNDQYSKLAQQQQNNLMAMMGGGQPTSAPTQNSQSNDSQGQSQGAAAPTMMQGVPNAQWGQDHQSAPSTSSSPLNPASLDPRMASMLYSQDPGKYMESFVAPYYKPAEITAQIRAAGIDPNSPQGRAIAAQALQKASQNMINVRPGGTVYNATAGRPEFVAPANGIQTQYGPQGPVASPVPGYNQAIAGVTGAETGARETNTPRVLPTAGGGTTFGYPQDVIGNPPAMRQPGERGKTTSTSATPPAPIDPRFKDAKDLPNPSGVGTNPIIAGRIKNSMDKDKELRDQYGKEADLADQKLQLNNEAMKVLSTSETGPLSAWMTENRGKLKELGVPDSLIPGSGTIVPTLELNKYLKNSALQGARQIYGSRMTQTEVKLQTDEMSPSAHMTGLAIKSLINQDNIRNSYAKQRAQMYDDYVHAGKDPLSFESWYSRNYPLAKFAQRYEQVQEIGKKYTPQQILEEARRRGISQ